MIRTIGERYTEKYEDVYAVFVDIEKAFDRVDWKKLMRILKNIGLDWKKGRRNVRRNKNFKGYD